MKSLFQKSILRFFLLGFLVAAGCTDKVIDEGNSICERNFSKEQLVKKQNGEETSKSEIKTEEKLQDICKDGVKKSYDVLYAEGLDKFSADDLDPDQVLDDEGNVKEQYVQPMLQAQLKKFREGAQTAQKQCIGYKASLSQMACLDGTDIGAAVIARGLGFDLPESTEQVSIDEDYYKNHEYYNIYDDYDDTNWVYLLMHRVYFPEFYPSYRRDQIFPANDPQNNDQSNSENYSNLSYYDSGVTQNHYYMYNSGTPGFGPWWYNYWYYNSITPYHYGYSGYYSNLRSSPSSVSSSTSITKYGPSSLPRPFLKGSPWYSTIRPGNAAATATGSVRAMSFREGSSWRQAAISNGNMVKSARGTILGTGSGARSLLNRGNFSFSGGKASRGGFGSSSRGFSFGG